MPEQAMLDVSHRLLYDKQNILSGRSVNGLYLALIFLLLKNVIYGATVFFTSALSASADVLDILALRFLMSFAALFVLKRMKILKIRVGVKDVFRPTELHRYIKPLLLASIFEPVLYMAFETLGITLTTGITAGVLLSLNPISNCICEEIFLKEKSTAMQKVFLALGIFGVVYISVHTTSAEGRDTPFGILCILLAVACGSLFLAFSRKSSPHFSAFEITYFSSMLGTVVFNGINVIRHIAAGDIARYFEPYFSVENLIGFVFLAIGSTIIATSMNNYAMSKTQLTTASAFGGVSTVVTVLIGVLCGERLYGFHVVGFSFILLRMIGVSWISIKNSRTKE